MRHFAIGLARSNTPLPGVIVFMARLTMRLLSYCVLANIVVTDGVPRGNTRL